MMKLVRSFLIFCYGLFTIGAQTLLFREFITALEGNDISVGLFFFSWFLWIVIGAFVTGKSDRLAGLVLSRMHLWFLLYLPAFLVQWLVIVYARELAQLHVYELPSLWMLLLLSISVNAPLSFITGALFPLVCRWLHQHTKLAVSWVYILEAAGSFAGGLIVTILLAVGIGPVTVFLIIIAILAVAVSFVELIETRIVPVRSLRRYVTTIVLFLFCSCIVLGLFFGVNKIISRRLQVLKWSKLLPAEGFLGSFQTAQAEYLYGWYQNQLVVISQGSTVEVLWDHPTCSRVAATVLCQQPDAKRILVVGFGLGLCREFLRLDHIEQVDWAYYDSQYLAKLDSVIPESLRFADIRLHKVTGELREYLASAQGEYDIIVVDLPDITSSALNRYYTLEFYQHIKSALTDNGILAVGFAGGENVMGTELVNLGASIKRTLERIFDKLVLVPGERSWFIASDNPQIASEPSLLAERFSAIKGESDIFDANGLFSVYLPDRAAKALQWYEQADLPDKFLINTDSHPLAYLYSLLLAAKQSGSTGAGLFKQLLISGPVVFVIPLAVFVVLRLLYIFGHPNRGDISGFEASFMVFSTGWAAIGTVIILMYLYQTYFGSLYLHIGIISSLFMAGLTAGAAIVRVFLKDRVSSRHRLLFIFFFVLVVHILVLITILQWPAGLRGQVFFAVAFVLCGLCGGGYFPIASRYLADLAVETGSAGMKLEISDHLGASIGGVLSSLMIIPVLGFRLGLIFVILLLVVNVPLFLTAAVSRDKVLYGRDSICQIRRLGYILLGLAVSVILCSNLFAYAGQVSKEDLTAQLLRDTGVQLKATTASITIDGRKKDVTYYKVFDEKGTLTGYIFSSADFAPDVHGFAGPITLRIYVDTVGQLQDFWIVKSSESANYMKLLDGWLESLKGRKLFGSEALRDVDTVSGATISSSAILTTLRQSAKRFYDYVLGGNLSEQVTQQKKLSGIIDIRGFYLVIAIAVSLLAVYFGGVLSRVLSLVFNLVVGGFVLNIQYSTEQVMRLLSGHLPELSVLGPVLLVVLVPVLVMLFGNIYCGWLCPFGAAQELIGYIVPSRVRPAVSINTMRVARFIKYAILFVLVIAFFLLRDSDVISQDPLISIFSVEPDGIVLIMAAVAMIGSVFYLRFWCRYICPAGAFLSIFNFIANLIKLSPAKHFGRCEFGLSIEDRADCIYCDRCRYESLGAATVSRQPSIRANVSDYLLIFSTVAVAIVISGLAVHRVSPKPMISSKVSTTVTVTEPVRSMGKARDVDTEQIRRMIRQGRLSDEEARYYKQLD